ncbi:hypothetical protein QLL95_gp1278 [Cotonvirus japonicus]|uniref:Uncharacterized protein n=1 Tax=Cotonvirus japonicus TaxID=2811091 RepID=A0ABM7NRQ1_9VIRU|nr:hypothetical protein QLL95_gp1278 [Cotonvirus japonicus]BCS82845.1 hypothetical protein [Cotonvirus japonicus]
MGNIFVKIWNINDPMSEFNTDPVICANCKEIALYRCSIKYNNDTDNDTELYSKFPMMENYWYGTDYSSTENIYNFIACDKCVGDHKKIFVHYPNGWRENAKYRIQYEPAVLEWFIN